eukprot:comp6164_c0_seq1/m.1992 comp6164_c0_seq1/g.1992  ORF comp6164_c0_seq1/g.1992 comp6164_c0_seq1/m.1992 type:complete len:335 (-) comp6164_c0_seq1:313-1317(-)
MAGSVRYADAVAAAEGRIRPYVRETPVEYSHYLTTLAGKEGLKVYLKLENEQLTGSFKVRGALNKLLAHEDIRDRVVTASTGNHALAVSHALDTLGGKGTIYLPTTVSQAKYKALCRYTNQVILQLVGTDCIEAELAAAQAAKENNMVYLSPYNDVDVMAGQGTIAVELCRQLNDITTVFVPVGGGGLMGGIASFMKAQNPNVRIVGCQPVNSAVMKASVEAGRILELESKDTLADGVAGGVEDGTVTFEVCRDLVDEWVLVTEDEIKWALRAVLEHHHKVIEGSAGLSIAAFMQLRHRLEGNVVLVMCGGNLSMAVLKDIVNTPPEFPACWKL